MVKINVEIDDEVKSFDLPENWDEVSVEQFVKIFSINREGLPLYQIATQTINCFTDISVEHLELMDYNDYLKINEVLKFTEKDIVPVTVEYIELDGVKYYLKTDFTQLTMGEVISIETLIGSSDNFIKVIDKLLCVFLRQKKDNGKLEVFKSEMMGRNEMFKKLPISQVLNIFNFFLDGVTS